MKLVKATLLFDSYSPQNFTTVLPFHLECANAVYMTLNLNS